MAELMAGLGVDFHSASGGRPLWLGGVLFEGEPGLAGHSDADVICHAVGDALLGAAALGDLGQHFPDSDPGYEGMAGLDLLSRVVSLLSERGLAPRRCDVTLIAERPSIAERRDEIRANLAAVLRVEATAVSVKATRPEGLGLTGVGAGCLALATVGGAESEPPA